MNTIDGNKLIAVFMNYPTELTKGRITDELAANLYNDWNSLMPVVEKIESLGFSFYIVCKGCFLNDKPPSTFGETKFQAVYTKVVEFINWYNKNL